MSGEGGPLTAALTDVRADLSGTERAGIAARIDAIRRGLGREASEGMVPQASVDLRLSLLADDVRGGLHGGAE